MKLLFLKNIKKANFLVIIFLSLFGRAQAIQNPIAADSIEDLIEMIIDVFIAIGTPIAVLFLIYTGFLFVMARGNPGKLDEAKKSLVWTLIGIAVLLGASVLAIVVKGTINQLGTGV